MPDEPEVHGLLALMLLHDSRRAARFRDGEIVLLADQDRALWDDDADRGRAGGARPRAGAARPRAVPGPGGDRVAARRGAARLAADRRALRRARRALTGSPVVELNRAVAVAEADGPEAGLAIVDGLELDDYRYLHSARAEMLRRLGRPDEARAAYAPGARARARRRRAAAVRAAARRALMASLDSNRGAKRAREARQGLGLDATAPLEDILDAVEAQNPVIVAAMPDRVAGRASAGISCGSTGTSTRRASDSRWPTSSARVDRA